MSSLILLLIFSLPYLLLLENSFFHIIKGKSLYITSFLGILAFHTSLFFAAYSILVVSFYQTSVHNNYLGRFVAFFIFIYSIGRVIGIPLMGKISDTNILYLPIIFLIVKISLMIFIQLKFKQMENITVFDDPPDMDIKSKQVHVKIISKESNMKSSNAQEQIIFESKNLFARPFTLSDNVEAFEFYGDEPTMSLIGKGKPWMDNIDDLGIISMHIKYYQKYPNQGFWAVIEKSSGRLIGHIGVKPININDKERVEVGYIVMPVDLSSANDRKVVSNQRF